MAEKKPDIRFKGFTDEWEETTIGGVSEVNPNTSVPATFEYVDLESVSGTSLKFHRTEQKETAPSRAQRHASYGDIFYQTVRPYQKNNYLFELDRNDFVFSTGYAQIRPSIASNFLFSILQRDSFVNTVLRFCTGTSYPAITPSALNELSISVPSNRSEQEKIGEFFQQLDELIAGKEQELEKLRQIRAALLDKMFPNGNDATGNRGGITG